jgi:hypothetical protein
MYCLYCSILPEDSYVEAETYQGLIIEHLLLQMYNGIVLLWWCYDVMV